MVDHYAEVRGAYYGALRSVRTNTLNMEVWLEYCLAGLVEEYERVAATVTELSALLTAGGSQPLRLTAGQERALTTLRLQGRREFARRDYEAAAGVGRTAASEEISALIRHGLLAPRGSGPRRATPSPRWSPPPARARAAPGGRPRGTTYASSASCGTSWPDAPAGPNRATLPRRPGATSTRRPAASAESHGGAGSSACEREAGKARRQSSFDADVLTLDPRHVEHRDGDPDAKLIILVGVEGEDAKRLERIAEARGQQAADVVAQLLRDAERPLA